MKVWGKRPHLQAIEKVVGIDPKVQQFLLCFKNNAFRFKISPEKHVSKLLQSVVFKVLLQTAKNCVRR